MCLKWYVLVSFVLLVFCKEDPIEHYSSVIKSKAAQEKCGICDYDKTLQLIMRNLIEATLSNLAQRQLEQSRQSDGESTAPFYYFANDFREDILRIGALDITGVSSVPSAYHHCTCAVKIQFASDAFAESIGVVI